MANIFTKIGGSIGKSLLGWNESISSFAEHSTNFVTFSSFFFWNNKGAHKFAQYIKSYGQNPLVYMVVNKIAVTASDIQIVAVDENGEPIEDSELIKALENPNDLDSGKEFIEKLMESLSLTGNAYVHYIEGIGAGFELAVLPPQRMQPICNKIGDLIGWVYVDSNNEEHKYEKEEVLHIHTSNIVNINQGDAKLGLSPLQAGWIIVESSSEKLKAEASIFKNRGIVGILTSDTDQPMLPKERERMQDEYDKELGGAEKYNRIKISSTKLRYLQTGMSPTDLKLLEGILSSLRHICALYGMPSVLFNDNENSTYNNVNEAKKTAYNDVYIPLANKIYEKLSVFLNEKLGVEEFIQLDLTTIEILKASTNETAQSLNNLSPLVANRVLEAMTLDEIRELIELGKLPNNEGAIRESSSGTVTATANGG